MIEEIIAQVERILRIGLTIITAYLVALWIASIWWTFRDIRSRTTDLFLQVAATLLVTVFSFAGLLIYTGSFAVGLGPVFWLMIAEIYPLRIRGQAMSVAAIANWGANFVVTISFLTLLNAIAAPAIIGFNKNPVKGYKIPAAMGIPIML